jgi:hypothetical protein
MTPTGNQATVQPGSTSVTAAVGTVTLSGPTASVLPGSASVAAASGTMTLVGNSAIAFIPTGTLVVVFDLDITRQTYCIYDATEYISSTERVSEIVYSVGEMENA